MPQPFRLLVSAASLTAAMLAVPGVHAQSSGALKKIKDSGEMTIGYRDSSIPFSYLGADAQPVGYSLDLCGRVVEAIEDPQWHFDPSAQAPLCVPSQRYEAMKKITHPGEKLV